MVNENLNTDLTKEQKLMLFGIYQKDPEWLKKMIQQMGFLKALEFIKFKLGIKD